MNISPAKIKKFILPGIALNIILCGFILYQLFYSRYNWSGPAEKKFTVSPGKNLNEITAELKNQDIISSAALFKIAARISGKDDQIISNVYVLQNGMNNAELLSILTDKSYSRLARFTIPPGYTLKQISKLAEKKLSLSASKFLAEASNDSLISLLQLNRPVKNLEGFLFPDSYDVPIAISEKELVSTLFNEFRKRILENDEVMDLIEERKTDLLNTVTLASIIEGETQLDSEMPVVAGVYLNRISKGMKLEADPTIQYILPDGPKKRLLYEDLKINSPYNTYLNKGLPPGPINNPGIKSIMAALNPDSHKYLFFVATGEGGHKFSENYADHLKAVQEYRNKMRERNDKNKK